MLVGACNDGTGAMDCCGGVTAGATCTQGDPTCWTPCMFGVGDAQTGTRYDLYCSNGQWLAGKGVFMCNKTDAGS